MKKILAFIGSPREKGNTATIVKEVARGASSEKADVRVYTLNDMNIKQCQSCFHCREEEGCSIDDDMQSIYKELKEADAIVIGAPIRFGQISSQTKTFIDRLYPLLDASHKPRLGPKNVVLVYSQGSSEGDSYKHYLDYNTNIFQFFNWNVIEPILILCGASTSSTATVTEKLMMSAFETGKKLAE